MSSSTCLIPLQNFELWCMMLAPYSSTKSFFVLLSSLWYGAPHLLKIFFGCLGRDLEPRVESGVWSLFSVLRSSCSARRVRITLIRFQATILYYLVLLFVTSSGVTAAPTSHFVLAGNPFHPSSDPNLMRYCPSHLSTMSGRLVRKGQDETHQTVPRLHSRVSMGWASTTFRSGGLVGKVEQTGAN